MSTNRPVNGGRDSLDISGVERAAIAESSEEQQETGSQKTGSQTGSSQTSSSLGPDSQSLLCSESMLSSTPPSDESLRLSHSDHEATNSKLNSKYSQDSGGGNESAHLTSVRRLSACAADLRQGKADDYPVGNGHGAVIDKHMNTNGIDRNKMTGSATTTSENLTWLSDVSASASPSQRSGSISSGLSGSHEPHSMLTGSGSSLFRAPTATDPSPRLFSPGHVNPAYTTASTLSPYSPTMHAQSSHLASISPYGAAFYPQYSPGYSTNPLLSSHYPHIESYSAVLASMGSHVQHAQSQLPRTTFLPGHIPQYLGSHGTLTPTNSPGPSMHRPMTSSQSVSASQSTYSSPDHHRRDSKSPKTEVKSEMDPRSRQGRTISPSTRGHNLSPSQAQVLHKSGQYVKEPLKHGEPVGKDAAGYKVPCGKEGSLKHRILTRPPDIHIEGSALGDGRKHGSVHQGIKTEMPSPKRLKGSIGHPPPLHPTSGSSPSNSGHSHLPPPPPLQPTGYANTPHFPPHFMKGSIIQLANGDLKRVEDLRTDDFVSSADISGDLKIDSSTVVRIEEIHERSTALLSFSVGEHRVQVTVEATVEHPFFVFGQGWSSCRPQRTQQRYGLTCHKLSVGDVCISLTHKDVNSKAAELASRQQKSHDKTSSSTSEKSVKLEERSASASSTQVHQGTQMQSTETQTREALTQVEAAGKNQATKTRKRRWSAPDHFSTDCVIDNEGLTGSPLHALGNHSSENIRVGGNHSSQQSGNHGNRSSPQDGNNGEQKGNHGNTQSDHNGNHSNNQGNHVSSHDNLGKVSEKT